MKFIHAIGNGGTWPKHTDDPEVNYEIDRAIEAKADPHERPMPPWSDAPDEEKSIYLNEVTAWKKTFGE